MFVMRSLFEIDDEKEFIKAALRVWRRLHPKRPPKTPGPHKLPRLDVCMATEAVLEALTEDEFKSIGWKELIARVQGKVKKQPDKLYTTATIRQYARDYVCQMLYWPEIPPKLLDHRQPWMKGYGKTRAERLDAFYQFRASISYPEGLEDLNLLPPKTKT